MKRCLISVFLVCVVLNGAVASNQDPKITLRGLKNYQMNTSQMVSAGLPNLGHLEALKARGVTKVVDLIPGDRSAHSKLMDKLELTYHNIPVDWENPTIQDFNQYVATMKRFEKREGITLTHCKLNWRGAVFTYLYRVTQLGESANLAKQDMLAIWQPNETWQTFIDSVLTEY